MSNTAQRELLSTDTADLMTLRQASVWASHTLGRTVTHANISYLVQYGKIGTFQPGASLLVSRTELENYYRSFSGRRQTNWTRRLGTDLNWRLSFEECKEAETTKHVHRLHPYKGKFIPQLVEYFLDTHTDEHKTSACFRAGDIVLDPFCGSGTTLVQANELGLHAIGIDISAFNALMSNLKVATFDYEAVVHEIDTITSQLQGDSQSMAVRLFEEHLLAELRAFNDKYFPAPEYRRRVQLGEVDERVYAPECAAQFLPIYNALLQKHHLQIEPPGGTRFLDNWFLLPVRREIEMAKTIIDAVGDDRTKALLQLILSRTVRSCRATTHSDLATLVAPITKPYYCRKHGKVCKPLFSILGWWKRYTTDALNRLRQFSRVRTATHQCCLVGDSRELDIVAALRRTLPRFADLAEQQQIRGIFSSPPYVGLIDYHEQHAYTYDLFGFQRRDEAEIGPLIKGQGMEAREAYLDGIAAVLRNCKKYLAAEYAVFLVANDKFNLYPDIAQRATMKRV